MTSKSKKLIQDLVKVDLNKNQKQALANFIDSQGASAFKNSNLLKAINKHDFDAVPNELSKWVMLEGRRDSDLEQLRQKEIELFTKLP